MAYKIEHLDDGDVYLSNETDPDDAMRFSRDKAQAIHNATAEVCGGGCRCFDAGMEQAWENMREELAAQYKLRVPIGLSPDPKRFDQESPR